MSDGRISARRAEQFASLLEGGRIGPATSTLPAQDQRFLEIVAALRELPPVEPRPEFVAGLRERLMSEADVVLRPEDRRLRLVQTRTAKARQVGGTRRHGRRWAALASAGLLASAGIGVATAAQASLPGSPLYPVKRGIESLQVMVATSQQAAGRDYLAQAGTRLDEVRALQRQHAAPDAVSGALSDFQSEATAGATRLFAAYQASGDGTEVSEVAGFARTSLRTLSDLQRNATTPSAAYVDAATLLSTLHQQASTLCSGCAGDLPLPSSLAARPALTGLLVVPTLVTSVGRPHRAGAAVAHARHQHRAPHRSTGHGDVQSPPDAAAVSHILSTLQGVSSAGGTTSTSSGPQGATKSGPSLVSLSKTLTTSVTNPLGLPNPLPSRLPVPVRKTLGKTLQNPGGTLPSTLP